MINEVRVLTVTGTASKRKKNNKELFRRLLYFYKIITIYYSMRYIQYLILFTLLPITISAQQKSISIGAGLAGFDGLHEMGSGILISAGYQQSYLKNRLRVGPQLTSGTFTGYGISDIPDQYFNITQLALQTQFDFLHYKAFNLFVGVGAGAAFSRGLIGLGGWSGTNDYGNFHRFYLLGNAEAGLRIAPLESNWSVQLIPICIGAGKSYIGYEEAEIRIAFRLNENKK